MNNDNTASPEQNSRRKLIAGLGVLSLFPLLKFGFSSKQKQVISCAPETKKLRMLTQDGTLVEVDASKITGTKEKISNKQLQSWVKKDL
jgi:hypothetical protein